jgi:hypothetical protein
MVKRSEYLFTSRQATCSSLHFKISRFQDFKISRFQVRSEVHGSLDVLGTISQPADPLSDQYRLTLPGNLPTLNSSFIRIWKGSDTSFRRNPNNLIKRQGKSEKP